MFQFKMRIMANFKSGLAGLIEVEILMKTLLLKYSFGWLKNRLIIRSFSAQDWMITQIQLANEILLDGMQNKQR